MLSKHPLEIPPGRKLSKEEIADALRLSIIAELDAVSLYLQLARAIDDEKIRKVFEEVAREEKTHVGEFLALLKILDPEQAKELEEGEKEVFELTGLKPPAPATSSSGSSGNSTQPFEEAVSREVKRLVESARVLVKKLPVVKLGRGTEAVPLERLSEKPERAILPLCEISIRFRVSQRDVDYALRTGQHVEMPEAVKAALALASEEDKAVVETLLKEAGVKVQLTSWAEPGTSVQEVVSAVGELLKKGYPRPYILLVNPARYTRLLAVSEKTGVTDLERVKMLVDEVVAIQHIPEDKAILLSATREVLDVVYGGDAEVDYIGPENGFHAFRAWSSIAIRVKSPEGIVLMESTAK
mgnify:CR=1 FL=1